MLSFRLAALAGLAALTAAPSAQQYATPGQEAPLAVTDLMRRGAGGAVAAMPTFDSPFFTNPAHITTSGFGLNVIGATVGGGGNTFDLYDFYFEEGGLGDAIERGLDTIPDAELQDLYERALDIGGEPSTADVAVPLPALRLGFGPVAVGAGVYTHAITRVQFVDQGVPALDLYARADIVAPVVVGVDLAQTPVGLAMPFGLRLGARAAYLERRLTGKSKPIDAIDPDGERAFVFKGSTVRVGLGALASDVGVPGLDVGLDVSNLGGAIDYAFETAVDISTGDGLFDNEPAALSASEQAEADALEAQFDERESEPVFRAGVAYRFPTALVPGVSETAIGLDYTTASTSSLTPTGGSTAVLDQSFQSGLRLGARTTIGGFLNLQAGLSQGMPSAGVGLNLKAARIEYATYGVEDGRLLGQLRRRNHVVRLRLGWF